MKNLRILFGITIFIMVISLAFIGCEEPSTEGDFIIENRCENYKITKITVNGAGISENVNLTNGQKKSFTLSEGSYNFSVAVEYTGQGETPSELNGSVLLNQELIIRGGINEKYNLDAYTRPEANLAGPAGTTFSWGYN